MYIHTRLVFVYTHSVMEWNTHDHILEYAEWSVLFGSELRVKLSTQLVAYYSQENDAHLLGRSCNICLFEVVHLALALLGSSVILISCGGLL